MLLWAGSRVSYFAGDRKPGTRMGFLSRPCSPGCFGSVTPAFPHPVWRVLLFPALIRNASFNYYTDYTPLEKISFLSSRSVLGFSNFRSSKNRQRRQRSTNFASRMIRSIVEIAYENGKVGRRTAFSPDFSFVTEFPIWTFRYCE